MAKETFSSLLDLLKSSPSSSVHTLVCDICGNKLSVFRKKKPCAECKRLFCSQCLQRCRDRAVRCKNCCILTMRPPHRAALLDLRVKDLQQYLTHHNVSTHGCLEKEDLVNVLVCYANTSGNSGNPHQNIYEPSSFNLVRPPARNSTNDEGNLAESGARNPRSTSATSNLQPGSSSEESRQAQTHYFSEMSSPQAGDSDSSSDTSFEIVNIENVTSADSSSSISKASSESNSSSGTPLAPHTEVSSEVLERPAETETQASNEEEVPSSGYSLPDVAALEIPEIREDLNAFNAMGQSESNNQSSVSLPNSSNNSSNNSPNFLRTTMASITSEADFEGLSVKQLKDVLHRHRVNYHGCCEKAELVERAKRLYRDYQSSRADLEKLDLDALCKICMDAPVECVMLECGHMATCTDCGRQLSECPICRQFVVRIVRTFKA